MLTCWYGRRGQGKTFAMTKEVVRALNKGRVVYTNYPVYWYGYDQSKIPLYKFLKKIKLKKKYTVYPQTNLRRFESVRLLPLVQHGSILALDEGYLYFDSYVGTRMDLGLRKWILFSRHMDIDIWYTAQRPTSIQVTMRAMTEVFYKCQAIHFPLLPVLFVAREYDLGSTDTVDEDVQYSRKIYWGNKYFFKFYNTKGDVFMSEAEYLELGKAFDVPIATLKEHFNG